LAVGRNSGASFNERGKRRRNRAASAGGAKNAVSDSPSRWDDRKD
jgi:hypothetical protein